MPIPDQERDRQFKLDAERKLSIRQLSEKYGIGRRQVSRLKKKLKEKESTSKPTIQQVSKLAKYIKATYYLDPEMIKDIKRLALEGDKNISQLIREILSRYLKITKGAK